LTGPSIGAFTNAVSIVLEPCEMRPFRPLDTAMSDPCAIGITTTVTPGYRPAGRQKLRSEHGNRSSQRH